MIRRSLFLQIYALIIASLAIAAVILVTLTGMGRFDQRDPLRAQLGQVMGLLLSPEDQPENVQRAVRRVARVFHADISVYDATGRLVASSGEHLPYNTVPTEPEGFRSGTRTYVLNTDHNMRVIMHLRSPFRNPRRNIAFIIVVIAAAVGAAAYPVARYLTRRLTNLRDGMEIWSRGALSTRVAVEGRDEIAEAAKTFNMAADRIEQLITAQKSLLANASHELRSPLARLRMATEMYEEAPSDTLKDEILKNLAELDELVEEILIMSRLESKQDEAAHEPLELVSLVAEEGAHFNADISGEPVIIRGNAKLVRRLVRNLFQNAARHGRPPFEAHISLRANTVSLIIRDHGDGISEAERERIFEPFYRPAGRAESSGGWGIGLALVRQIAKAHGGTVRYQDQQDGGAGFVVEFPVA
ncbi:HAMP domain-containing sensor histidine kinase [Rhizobium sp. L1K21]|uniref:sensor histidine kinase n=1 Tax=Rhizobium sp. L1K21 TaxID=2954933 RepID=UPI002092C267|nr:ATP-binding protein [Rhizobium sp. L1K21]MCO6186130.1 ATP-binding protein [Rhizobium sp. L1K21]